ncbi:MAG TPA: zinc metallopeptidase [Chitinophagales bacterium]|nr:zinc metallopeptidase [Chitinophagales bacterium]
MSYWVLILIIFAASWLVGAMLKSKFHKYSQVGTSTGLSGKEIAEKMLRDHNITGVQVISVPGQLTDHYNPLKRTVNLSPEVYQGRSVAAAAVAAHECGHAVQHARAYMWLQMRSALVPVVSVTSRWMQWVILAGILLIQVSIIPLTIGVALFAMTTLFAFITLPVEFDASRRALVWLESTRMTTRQEHDMAKDALKWAAMTYVVAALASLATLLYYLSMLNRRR